MSTALPDDRARLLRARSATAPLELKVSGVSMGRAIVGGSTVRVVGADAPARGQVWAFVSDGGEVLVHRCRRVGSDGVVLQGDANLGPDQPVDLDRLIGRVTAVRVGGTWQSLGRGDRIRGATVLGYRDLRTGLAAAVGPRWRDRLLRTMRRG